MGTGIITLTIFNVPYEACGETGEIEGTVEGVPAACAAPGCEGQGDIEESEHEFPSRFEVCDACEGHGMVLCEGMRGYAYSAEEFAESFDDEEREEYFKRGGRYDVTCDVCRGARVVPVVDEKLLTPKQKALYKIWLKNERDRAGWDAEDRMTRFYESGGRC